MTNLIGYVRMITFVLRLPPTAVPLVGVLALYYRMPWAVPLDDACELVWGLSLQRNTVWRNRESTRSNRRYLRLRENDN